MKTINLKDKLTKITEYWSPKITGELNDAYIKLAKFKGEFTWHKHEQEDELFLVVDGELTIQLRDRNIYLTTGEFTIIPKGVEHKPVAHKEAHVLLIEPKSTLNTGDQQNELTKNQLDWV